MASNCFRHRDSSSTATRSKPSLIRLARRLGSKLRPVLHVFDAKRLQLAWASPTSTLSGDARLRLKLPADGTYSIELHDAQYAAPGPGFFRLKVGQWQFADAVYPPVVPRDKDVTLELLSGSGPTATKLTIPFRAPANVELVPVALPTTGLVSGVPPVVQISELTELLETTEGPQPMPLPTLPVAVSGRLNAVGQLDRFRLTVTPGTKLSFEVFAERLGSPIDAVLELRNAQDAVLATADDVPPSIDPRLDFVVPAGLEVLDVVIRDTVEVGSDAAIYRLVVKPTESVAKHFDVVIRSSVSNVAANETQVAELLVDRRGYVGPIQLAFASLPAGVTAQGTEIAAGATGGLVTLTNSAAAPAQIVTSLRATAIDPPMSQPVRIELPADDRSPLWLREQFALATTAAAASPFQVAWANPAAPESLVLTTKQALPIKLVRPSGSVGPIRLTLIHSHALPKLNGVPTLTLQLRGERVVEVVVDPSVQAATVALAAADKLLADSKQQLAAAKDDAKVAAEAKVQAAEVAQVAAVAALQAAEAKAVYASELAVLIPVGLPSIGFDFAVRAELLTPDKVTVLRTAYSPVRRIPALNPLKVTRDGPAILEGEIDPKTGVTLKVVGKLERLGGYKGDVTFTLTGAPAGVVVTNAVVKTDQTDYSLELRFPATFAAGDVAGIKLVLTGPADPQSGNQPLKGEDVDVPVKLTKAAT